MKKQYELKLPVDKRRMFEAFLGAKESLLFDAVLHVLERSAVLLSDQAGMPGKDAAEAKACARAASEIRNVYGLLDEMATAAGQNDPEQVGRLSEVV